MWQKLFNGRYGLDNLTLVLAFLSVLLLNIDYIWIAGVGLLGWSAFRTFSRNIEKRRQELRSFEKATTGVRKLMAPVNEALARGILSLYRKSVNYRARLKQRKDFVFIRCRKCRNMLRLPRNKGKLLATCPVCKSEYTVKT